MRLAAASRASLSHTVPSPDCLSQHTHREAHVHAFEGNQCNGGKKFAMMMRQTSVLCVCGNPDVEQHTHGTAAAAGDGSDNQSPPPAVPPLL